jgi:hypothetical protein
LIHDACDRPDSAKRKIPGIRVFLCFPRRFVVSWREDKVRPTAKKEGPQKPLGLLRAFFPARAEEREKKGNERKKHQTMRRTNRERERKKRKTKDKTTERTMKQ